MLHVTQHFIDAHWGHFIFLDEKQLKHILEAFCIPILLDNLLSVEVGGGATLHLDHFSIQS